MSGESEFSRWRDRNKFMFDTQGDKEERESWQETPSLHEKSMAFQGLTAPGVW